VFRFAMLAILLAIVLAFAVSAVAGSMHLSGKSPHHWKAPTTQQAAKSPHHW
jgi:cell division protein FtsN